MAKEHAAEGEKKNGSRFGKMFSRAKRTPRQHASEQKAPHELSPPSLNDDKQQEKVAAAAAEAPASSQDIDAGCVPQLQAEDGESLDNTSITTEGTGTSEDATPKIEDNRANVPESQEDGKETEKRTIEDKEQEVPTTAEDRKHNDAGYETPEEEEETGAAMMQDSIEPEHKYTVHHGESWQRLHDMFDKNPSVPKLVESPRLTKSKAQVGEINKEHI